MIDTMIIIFIALITVVFEASLVFATVELWKIEEKFVSMLFLAMAVISSAAIGYVLVGRLLQ